MRQISVVGYYLIAVTLVLCSLGAVAAKLPQHEMLKMDDGEWQAKLTFFRDDKATQEFIWHESNTMVGELWSLGRLYGELDGELYEGYATLGYDPVKQKYVGTWLDSSSPEILQMEGNYQPESRTLTLFYNVTIGNGEVQKRKNIMVYQNPDFRDFSMYIWQADRWIKSMDIDYTRVKD